MVLQMVIFILHLSSRYWANNIAASLIIHRNQFSVAIRKFSTWKEIKTVFITILVVTQNNDKENAKDLLNILFAWFLLQNFLHPFQLSLSSPLVFSLLDFFFTVHNMLLYGLCNCSLSRVHVGAEAHYEGQWKPR